MVDRRITAKKTPTGYKLTVFVKDGDVFGDLQIGIRRFFEQIERLEHLDRYQRKIERKNHLGNGGGGGDAK